MATGTRTDPYRGFNFLVEIDGRACLTTSMSDWLESEVEREGLRKQFEIDDRSGDFGV